MTDLALFAPPPADRRFVASTAVSIGLHLGVVLLLVMVSPLRQMVVPPPRPVTVQIVTEAEMAALEAPPPAPTSPPAPVAPAAPAEPGLAPSDKTNAPVRPAPPSPTAPAAAPGTHVATTLYAGGILREPGMERLHRTFETLAGSEKMMQLCNIEGLEQIRRAEPKLDPDTLVPYAMDDPLSTGLVLLAPGAAVRSRRRWYGVTFKCAVAADLESVNAFEFKLGDAIPPELWEEHNLNAADANE